MGVICLLRWEEGYSLGRVHVAGRWIEEEGAEEKVGVNEVKQ